MDSKNELLLAVREAKKYLREGTDIRVTDVLAVFESIAPFLDKQAIVKMKCQGCRKSRTQTPIPKSASPSTNPPVSWRWRTGRGWRPGRGASGLASLPLPPTSGQDVAPPGCLGEQTPELVD